VATKESHVTVMLSAAKHLAFSVAYEDEILRLSPQDDITTRFRGGGEEWMGAERRYLAQRRKGRQVWKI
jgi:hypothetical protein